MPMYSLRKRGDESDKENEGLKHPHPLIILGAVSSLWRQITFSNPRLWTSIAFTIHTEESLGLAHLLRLFFENSAEFPLTITFHFRPNRWVNGSLIHPIIDDLILENLWRTPRLDLINPPLRWFSITDLFHPSKSKHQYHFPDKSAQTLSVVRVPLQRRLTHCYSGGTVNNLPPTVSTLEMYGDIYFLVLFALVKLPNMIHLVLDNVDSLPRILNFLSCDEVSDYYGDNDSDGSGIAFSESDIFPVLNKLTIRASSGLDSSTTMALADMLVIKFKMQPYLVRFRVEIVAPEVDWVNEAIVGLMSLVGQGKEVEVIVNSERVSWLQ